MRRLYSSFATGAPGVGLLLQRLACGAVLLLNAAIMLRHGSGPSQAVLPVISIGLGLLLMVGLWTPIVGVLTGVVAVLIGLPDSAHTPCTLLAALAVSLALLGPGVWSLDARLYGWKRIQIDDQH